jgi:hypothetical protein
MCEIIEVLLPEIYEYAKCRSNPSAVNELGDSHQMDEYIIFGDVFSYSKLKMMKQCKLFNNILGIGIGIGENTGFKNAAFLSTVIALSNLNNDNSTDLNAKLFVLIYNESVASKIRINPFSIATLKIEYLLPKTCLNYI